MHLLELKNIGKIYASEGTIAVGIRGVNLSFDIGEFVAITGQSGSGKSTLLNVISGMDSYEEGEMYIEGETTSHYVNEDWELYREKYISFIFQDYNIIDSFTVLENVELALLHIEDAKERRERAKELIKRVGLEKQMKQRGSHLSGGQKQRTVIARALAKDSPVILADEPTGNLDSQTSKEIIELLKEISKDKLIIVVTHNFEEVAECATREIRVYDGAVASDRQLCGAVPDKTIIDNEWQITEGKDIETAGSEDIEGTKKTTSVREDVKGTKKKKSGGQGNLKKGLTIGYTIFKRKPRLSTFLSVLFVVTTICMYLFVGVLGKIIYAELLADNYLFQNEPGRVIVTKRDGSPISDKEVSELAQKYDASDYIHCDILEDQVDYYSWDDYQSNHEYYSYDMLLVKKYEDVGEPDIGHYPEKDNECLLYIPYSLADRFGDEPDSCNKVAIGLNDYNNTTLNFDVAGIIYCKDNNVVGKVYVTDDAYKACSAMTYLKDKKAVLNGGTSEQENIRLEFDFGVAKGIVVLNIPGSLGKDNSTDDNNYMVDIELNKVYSEIEEEDNKDEEKIGTEYTFSGDTIEVEKVNNVAKIVINPGILIEKADKLVDENYAQCSLYFENDRAANKAISEINKTEYIGISADMKVLPYSGAFFDYLFSGVMMVIVLAMLVCFLTFVVGICTRRSVDAFKGDIGIMRSMGIRVKVVKIAIYMRMLLAMIAPVVVLFILTNWGYRQPFFSSKVMYMYPIHYLIIFFGVLIVVIRSTKKQVKRLFSTTVNKSLKKGEMK